MAVNFVARKCACGGKLEFDPVKKIWICKYCGTVVEREATFDKVHVDGIEGINDVVRQTLKDVANQKMESAFRNLEDCERKDHQHVGTLIASISYYLANISHAKTKDEAKASLDKVKIYAKRFKEQFPVVEVEEINLYESFGDGTADVIANLIAVFDTLGDQGRVEYLTGKLKPEEVFSAYSNKALLKISIKQGRYDLVDAIIANVGHVDRKSALVEVMDNYPNNEKKGELIQKLFDAKVAEELSKKYFEGYFSQSQDSVETKCKVIALLNGTNIHCSADAVVKSMADQITGYDVAKLLFSTIYDARISDQETEGLLVFCLIDDKSYDVQAAFFDVLIEKKVFVQLNGRTVIAFLDSAGFPADEKVDVLQKMLSFQMENKALDSIYNYYLNNNADMPEDRVKIIDALLTEGAPISSNTVKNYFLRTKIDGERKPEVVEKIFATGINKTYLGDLLAEYLLHTEDSDEQKKIISDYLISQGFKMDSGALGQYVVSGDDKDQKIAKIKQIAANGTQVKADTLNAYITSLRTPEEFSEEIFNLLAQGTFIIGYQAYQKFLFFCRDVDKVRHHERLLRALDFDVTTQRISVTHCGNSLNCNFAQAYLLNSTDSYEVANAILQQLLNSRVKLVTELAVNGSTWKFKKYVGDNKNRLSSLALQLSNDNRLFSLF